MTLLWLARQRKWLVPGDLLVIFFIWYGSTRFILESLRTGNWTFFGIPTAQLVTLGFIFFGIVLPLVPPRAGPAGRTAGGDAAGRRDGRDLERRRSTTTVDDDDALEEPREADDAMTDAADGRPTTPGATHRPATRPTRARR